MGDPSELPITVEIALTGAVLIAAGGAFMPLVIAMAQRLFPGRQVFFARWGFSHVLMAVTAYLMVSLLAGVALKRMHGDEPSLLALLVASAIVQAAVCGLVIVWAVQRDPEGLRCLGFWRGKHIRALFVGLLVFLLSYPVIFGVQLMWPWIVTRLGEDWQPQDFGEGFLQLAGGQLAVAVTFAVLIIPFFEELFFRGFLQPLLVQNFRDKGGVVLTSALFGILHGTSAFLPIFVLSLVLGGVMLRTQRLVAVWGMHALNNGMQIGLLLLSEKLLDPPPGLLLPASGVPFVMTFFPRKGLFEPVAGGAFVAANAIVTGDVDFAQDVGIWFGCVVRGDDAPLTIGRRTNVQDLTMIHADTGVPNVIGEEVTIGHRCVLHGARVGDRCLIGMGAILLGGSEIGEGSIIAAGAVVKENMQVPPRSLVVGVPARIVREVTDDQLRMIEESAEGYVRKIRLYLPESDK